MIPFRSPVPRFAAGGDLFVGDGALIALRALAGTRVAVIHTPAIGRDAAYMALLERSIGAPQLSWHEWPGGEPTFAVVTAVAAALRAQRPDVIVAVGGGSVIDGARVAWLLYEHPSLEVERAGGRLVVPPLRGLARFAAVPTTAGAGAEVSSAVVLTDAEGRKIVLVSGEFLADLVVLDPRASAGVPAQLLRQSLCDVMGHMVEGHCSRVANPFVAELTRQAFPSLWQSFLLCAQGDLSAAERLRLMQLSLQAGWIQNHRPPGLGHAVAHALARVGVPHAVGVGLCLGPSLRENLYHPGSQAALGELAASVGITGPEALVRAIDERVQAALVAVAPLRERIAAQSTTLVETAVADITARTNPVPVQAPMVERVLEAIR